MFADANLPTGEIVVSGMFESPDTIASVAAETVPSGAVAISVSVDQVHAVAGLVASAGGAVHGGELVGLLPRALLQSIPPARWPELGLSAEASVEARLDRRSV